MKKVSIFLLSLVLFFTQFHLTAQAQTPVTYTESYQDGEYTIIETTTLYQSPSNARTTKSVTANRTVDVVNYAGTTVASFTLTATFLYNGTSASCSSTSCSKYVKDSSWAFTTATSGKSGASATGYYTLRHYVNGKEESSKSGSVRMTCSKTGTIS